MKHSLLFHFSLILFPFVAATAATVTQPVELIPFTFAGRIVDYAHVAYDSDTVVEIRVKAQDGTLLAKTTTATAGKTAFNYVINIPLSNQAVANHAKVGDTVTFEFTDPDGQVYTGLVTGTKAVLGNPGAYTKLDVILATDANDDGVADEYVETLEYLMWKNGVETYDPNADNDGDGQSNYAEYVAGTNPFDATDRLTVKAMALAEDAADYIAFKFLASQGRYYTVDTTRELDTPNWTGAEFAVQDPSAALQGALATGAGETGYRVIYLKKGTDPSRFWKLKVE